MSIRITRRQATTSAACSLLALALPNALAQGKPPEEGLDYIALDKPAATEAGAAGTDPKLKGKIEVVEFFWYNCPHCNAFEPRLEQWIKAMPKDVHFRRQPVAFRPEFVPQQHLYFTLETMGKVEQFQRALFKAIHEEKQDLSTRDGILKWVGAQDQKQLNIGKFTQLFDSFAIASKATKATQLQTAYVVKGVPALGVAGKYYADGSTAQSMERALQIVNLLIERERAGGKAPAKKK